MRAELQADRGWLHWVQRCLCAVTLLALWLPAGAQPHQERVGGYTLRSSVVDTTMLPQATAHAHGVDPAPGRALLNVVVLHRVGTRELNAEARITATASDLNGRQRSIELRKVIANGMVSYMGAFDFLPREVLDFHLMARPQEDGPELTLAYRERMWFY